MNYLVLLRHGQSQWNLENRFTGWVDVDLTENGEAEARRAGQDMKDMAFDKVFTSTQTRAKRTAQLAMEEMEKAGANMANIKGQDGFITTPHDDLRERDYGDLAGLNKAETAEKYGKDQVHIWRRSFDTPPPNGESLSNVVARVGPYYESAIKEFVEGGQNVLVAAHGNSLRALLVALGEHEPEEIPSIEIPTGRPLVFEFEAGKKMRKYYIDEKPQSA